MRLPMPSARDRRRIVGILRDAFEDDSLRLTRLALGEIAAFYDLKPPRVEFVERPEVMRATLGVCYEDGLIQLVHPDHWRRRKTENTAAEWIAVALHEAGHLVLWSDCERKADLFAERFGG